MPEQQSKLSYTHVRDRVPPARSWVWAWFPDAPNLEAGRPGAWCVATWEGEQQRFRPMARRKLEAKLGPQISIFQKPAVFWRPLLSPPRTEQEQGETNAELGTHAAP